MDFTRPTEEEQARLTGRQLKELMSARSKYDVALVAKKGGRCMRFEVSYGSHRVWLQERPGCAAIQLETDRSTSGRRSTATRDWLTALEEAERHIHEQVLAHHESDELERELGATGGDPDLLIVITYYRNRCFTSDPSAKDYVGPDHRKRLERTWAIIDYKFGIRRPVSWYSAGFVEKYVKLRVSGPIEFPEHWGRTPCRGTSVRTAVNELKDFSSVLSYAAAKGKIRSNPLEGYTWDKEWLQGDRHAVKHMEEAHIERHKILMARSSTIDPKTGERLPAPINRTGTKDRGDRARCIQALLFHHGHRTVSTLALMCEDIAFTRDEMRILLGAAPNHREWWADEWPFGAIFWRRSKVDYLRVTPMSRIMRLEVDNWRARHPDWRPGMPVFPQERDSTKPIRYDHINKWMHSALRIARADLEAQGIDDAMIDRWLGGALLHGWRDHWATQMDQLGYGWDAVTKRGESKLDLHNHVAFMGDWATSGGTQAEVYAKLNPGILYAIAEFEKAEDVVRRFSTKAQEDYGKVIGSIYGNEDDVIPITRRASGR